jgi:tetratricopeptide (TPR) repeat protein
MTVNHAAGLIYGGLLLMVLVLAGRAAVADVASFDEAEKTIADYTAQLEQRPGDAKLLVLRGDLYFQVHEFDRAVEDYTAALALDDKLDMAYYGRGLAYGRMGFIRDGIKDLSHYIDRNPQSSRAYTKRGVRYLWLGDGENAYRDLSRAVALDAANAEAHDDLGVVLAQQGRYREAIVHFLTTVHLDPSYQKGYHNLAIAYYVTENDALALETVNESLRLDPAARDSLLLKVKILQALGKTEAAAALEEDAAFLPEGDGFEHVPVR